MSDAETEMPMSDPMQQAWEQYRSSESYANSKHWALRVAPMFLAGEGREATHDLMPLEQRERHVDGSMWAAFVEGWNAAMGSRQ